MSDKAQGSKSYPFDAACASEIGHILFQDHLMTEVTGGLFPGRTDKEIERMKKVLDIGCGPGGWATSVARRYAHINAFGIDDDRFMIPYANAQRSHQNIPNASFEVVDALKPWTFAPIPFDMINIRFAASWVPRQSWTALFRQCYRASQAGGFIRWSERDHLLVTNSALFEQCSHLLARASHQAGFGFSPDGSSLSITPMQASLLRDAGYREVKSSVAVIDISYGSPYHMSQMRYFLLVFKHYLPLLCEMGLVSLEKAALLFSALQAEAQTPTFCGLMYFLTVEGNV